MAGRASFRPFPERTCCSCYRNSIFFTSLHFVFAILNQMESASLEPASDPKPAPQYHLYEESAKKVEKRCPTCMAAYMGHRNTFRKSFRKFASSSVSVPRNSPSTNSAAPARHRPRQGSFLRNCRKITAATYSVKNEKYNNVKTR